MITKKKSKNFIKSSWVNGSDVDPETVDEEPPRGNATANSHLLLFIIYLCDLIVKAKL